MVPTGISEQLLFNTVRIEASNGSTGTGFFFNFEIGETKVPVLMTNKHVINYNPLEKVKFFLHLKEDTGESVENFSVEIQVEWIFHSTKDLCFTFMAPVFEKVKEITKKEVFYISAESSIIYDKQQLKDLRALEEIVMIGYPSGLWDNSNNFPIFRKGFTASHPGYDFNDKGIGLVDTAVYPGSSGSPIYILNESGYTDKKGDINIGTGRLIFLGILFAGPVYNTQGQVDIIDIPTKQQYVSQTQLMMNLGYYIKSEEILEFNEYIEKRLQRER